MGTPISKIEISKDTVDVGETFVLSVTVNEHRLFARLTHFLMSAFTHIKLKGG